MAWTQATISSVEDGIATAAISGWADLNLDGKGMRRYQLSELLALRTAMKQAVAGTAGTLCTTLLHFSKG